MKKSLLAATLFFLATACHEKVPFVSPGKSKSFSKRQIERLLPKKKEVRKQDPQEITEPQLAPIVFLDYETGEIESTSINLEDYLREKAKNHYLPIEPMSLGELKNAGSLEEFRGIVRKDWSALTQFITPDDYYVQVVTARLLERSKSEDDFSKRTLEFVQSIPYVKDKIDIPRYPLETLAVGGDCEDTAILTCSILLAGGVDCGLIELPKHIAPAVRGSFKRGRYYRKRGGKYFYAQTTDPDYKMGQMPKKYIGKTLGLYYAPRR